MDVGIVLEHREIDNPWADHQWTLVGVVPGKRAMETWRELRRGDGWVHYYAATLSLTLFRKETEGYKVNLSQPTPRVYVVLRPEETGEHDHEVTPFHATVCPFEAEGYDESGDEWVQGVEMPAAVRAWVEDFVERHHVHVPFIKRKRQPHGSGHGR